MIQDIEPRRYYVEFKTEQPTATDFFLYFEGQQVLVKKKKDQFAFLTFADLVPGALKEEIMSRSEYLFAIDNEHFFSVSDSFSLFSRLREQDGFLFPPDVCIADIGIFRDWSPQYQSFAGVTASQIYRFRKSRTFCGRCGTKMIYGTAERSMCCPSCGNVEYPKISPAITTAVISRDKLLMAKGIAMNNFALIAGYMEIGETFEDTVHREVMEEVGLKVKNLHFYKSQPWAFSDTEMVGYFAELDGDDAITLQKSELSDARWFTREEIGDYPSISLTFEMVRLFKEGKVPFRY